MDYQTFKDLSVYEQIRVLTGIVPQDIETITNRIALINLIVRVELKEADASFLDDTLKKLFEGN